MRRILVDFARSRNYAKRGGGDRVISLEEVPAVSGDRAREMVALDEGTIHRWPHSMGLRRVARRLASRRGASHNYNRYHSVARSPVFVWIPNQSRAIHEEQGAAQRTCNRIAGSFAAQVKMQVEVSMATVTIEEAQAKLPEIIKRLQPGEEITITDHGQPLAKMKKAERATWPCKAGSYRKSEFWMAPDFDAPLEEFKEYME